PTPKPAAPQPEHGFQVELGLQLESFEVVAFVGPAGCPECGDPLDGPALIKRCQPNHKAATGSPPPHSSKKLRPTERDNSMTTTKTLPQDQGRQMNCVPVQLRRPADR